VVGRLVVGRLVVVDGDVAVTGGATSHVKSRGLTAWLWLFKPQAGPKAKTKPSFWPGLARPIWAWLGPAHGLRPGQAHHY
jgi:hypothetical protein